MIIIILTNLDLRLCHAQGVGQLGSLGPSKVPGWGYGHLEYLDKEERTMLKGTLRIDDVEVERYKV